VLDSSAQPGAIYAWYRDWMLGHGWTPFQPLRAGTQRSVEGYQRGDRERFNVAMDDPTSLSRALGRTLPAGVTVFEVRYIVFPS